MTNQRCRHYLRYVPSAELLKISAHWSTAILPRLTSDASDVMPQPLHGRNSLTDSPQLTIALGLFHTKCEIRDSLRLLCPMIYSTPGIVLVSGSTYSLRYLVPDNEQTCTWSLVRIGAWLNGIVLGVENPIPCPRSKTRASQAVRSAENRPTALPLPLFLTLSVQLELELRLYRLSKPRTQSVQRANIMMQWKFPLISQTCRMGDHRMFCLASPVPSKPDLSLTAGKYEDGSWDDGRCTSKKRLSLMSIN